MYYRHSFDERRVPPVHETDAPETVISDFLFVSGRNIMIYPPRIFRIIMNG